jgi:serine/threonine protein kinase
MARAAKAEGSPASGGKLGRYRLLMELGQGGMGTIHLALATGTGDFRKLVVLKELREERVSDTLFVEMFMREAMLAGRLNHANVVQTIEAARDGKRLFLAMEFLDGQPLAQVMRAAQKSGLSQRALLQLLCEALAGLHYAHELKDYGGSPLGIVHCDVSPQNIFVTYDGNVKLVDFGVARARGSEDTNTGFRGRLSYAAPEQIRGDELDCRTDVFAMGVILWEIVAQRRFVTPGTPTRDTISRRLGGREPSIEHVVPTVSADLWSICKKALRLNPAQRYSSAEEFRQALANYLHHTGGPPDPAEISSFMSQMFGERRRAMHQLIHDHLEDTGTSVKHRVMPFEFGNDEVTRVGDLSPLVDLTRSEDTDSIARGLRPNRSRLISGAVSAAVVAAGVGAWAMLSGGEPTLLNEVEAKGPEPLVSAGAVARATEATRALNTQVSEPTGSQASAVEILDGDATAIASEEVTAPDAQKSTKSPPKRARKRRRPVVVQRPAYTAIPGPRDAREAPPTSTPAPPTAGQDLKKPRDARRELDENPFQ